MHAFSLSGQRLREGPILGTRSPKVTDSKGTLAALKFEGKRKQLSLSQMG